MKLKQKLLTFGVLLATSQCVHAQEAQYLPTWSSLARVQEAPEWFRDAKFGIYFHWGVYSVPAFGGEWYPRWMYVDERVSAKEGAHPTYLHHVEKYGHPHEFGYHDFIPMFRAEHFDAEEWANLFKKAGAQFAGPVAEHHDGFAMWDSDVTPWNVAAMGPKRDITGELETAVRDRGMKFLVTFHHARNLQRYTENHQEELTSAKSRRAKYRESHFPYLEGMDPRSTDPELRLLYGNVPADEWHEKIWLGKLKEVIDRYHPDLIWFDGWLDSIPEEYRQQFAAYYYNRAAEWGKDVVVTRKEQDLPLSCSLEDFEKGRTTVVTENCWLSDDTISRGSWCYTEDLKIKPTKTVLHSLIDIVCKNGCLLLNISPKADGTIPDDQRVVLLELGEWLEINGEAIYNTRPWKVFGEGPTRLERGGHFIREPDYTPQDIRYTRAKDDSAIYAILMGKPKPGEKINFESMKGQFKIDEVELLGSDAQVEWTRPNHFLEITMPDDAPSELAVVFKLHRVF